MRKFVCGMLALCLALSVAGCGKSSEEKQAANYYQKELGLDKDEAEELAHELYGKDEDEPSVSEGAPGETVIEPLPELVNSEWYDCKVQIYDMVFNYRLYMAEEDIRKIVEGSAYDVELEEGFDENGNVCLKGLTVNGKQVAQFWKLDYDSNPYATRYYGLSNNVDYYSIGYSLYEINWDVICCYDKASLEFEDFKTRDDVLAYLAENGFVEVEKEQSIYADSERINEILRRGISSSYGDSVEFADTQHYFCKGAQSITFYRIHKLGETDQEVAGILNRSFSGAHLNLVNVVTFSFNTDGTIDVSKNFEQYAYYIDSAGWNEYAPGWYLPGYYDMSNFTLEFEILGEKID